LSSAHKLRYTPVYAWGPAAVQHPPSALRAKGVRDEIMPLPLQPSANDFGPASARPLVPIAPQDERPAALGDLSSTDAGLFAQMSPNCLVVLDSAGTIARTNANFTQTFAMPEGRDFTALFHAQDRARVTALLCRAAGGVGASSAQGFHATEGRMIDTNGQMLWLRWEVFPPRTEGEALYAIGRDITALKVHEQTLARKQAELTEAESIAHMGRWHWEVGQPDMVWSPELYAIFGQDQATFVPGLESLAALVHDADSDRLLQVFQRAMIERASYEVDLRMGQEGTDTFRVVRCEGRCELDAEGDVVALYGIMQDITARVLYEYDLRAAKEKAERACAAKTQFLANMSHELRTPLNAVIGFSEIMQSQLLGPFGSEKYGEYVDSIHTAGRRLAGLIDDILDMSKISAGKYVLAHEAVNLDKIARLAAHMVEGAAADAGVHLSVEEVPADAQAAVAWADRQAVMQVALNLLSNAVKFTPAGGSVRLSAAAEAGGARLTISDTGIGIPPQDLQRVTLPFEQVDGAHTRSHEGPGLGLAIVKELVDLHDGRLAIRSAEREGTCVTVWLPAPAGCARALDPSAAEVVV